MQRFHSVVISMPTASAEQLDAAWTKVVPISPAVAVFD
jgi:hypothetical protein